jgi:hypothetical protein
MKRILLTTLVFIAATFATEGTSHFVINKDFYVGIPFLRQEPIVFVSLFAMIAQGLVMGWMYPRFHDLLRPLFSGWRFAMCVLVILGGYIVLVEPSKYQVPSIGQWMLVEGTVAFLQFSLFGVLLGLTHRKAPRSVPS